MRLLRRTREEGRHAPPKIRVLIVVAVKLRVVSVVSCAPLRACADFSLRTRIRATAVERNTACRTKDVGRGVKENGGWGVDGMTKDGQRRHCLTCERLFYDAVGCQVSTSTQTSAAAAPHLRLARPGELCQWHLEWHDRGRQREDRQEVADFMTSSRSAPRVACRMWSSESAIHALP